MAQASTRREFLEASAAATAVAGFDFLGSLPALSAQDVQPPRNMAAVTPDLEPLVRLIEDTPRERLIDAVIERIRQGTTYGELFGAGVLAGVRGIQPRPVGFKFHAVLVMNSAHLASQAAPDRDRWLPLLWSLNNFKASQEQNRTQGDWRMPALADAQLPDSSQAGRRFREAMDNWQEEAADRAIAAWSRTAGANEIYEAFWRLGSRDFRDIGHKAIFVANSYRTLQTIGWRHAEPILRSLAYALLQHEGTNPAERDGAPDRPGRDNLPRLARIRADWQRGQPSREASVNLLACLRIASASAASEEVVRLLNDRVDPSSIWDGLFLASGEWLMGQPGIAGLHCVTSMNALYFGYQTSANDETRRYLMLQAAAFLPMFRQNMQGRGQLANLRLDTLEPLAPTAAGAEGITEILADISRDKQAAARKTLALIQANPSSARDLIAGARRLIFSRGTDSHDYKFSAAALEDYFHVTPALRSRFLASSVYWLKGSAGQDTDLYRRVRGSLARPDFIATVSYNNGAVHVARIAPAFARRSPHVSIPGQLTPSPRLLLGPGPSDVHPRVLSVMSTPLMGHLDPQFLVLMNEVQEMLRQAYQTKNPMTLAISATGMAGMETCLVNLLEPGDKMLACVKGFFGTRIVDVGTRTGADVVRLDAPWGNVFDLNLLEAEIKKHRPKVVGIVHAETLTGAWQPIEELGKICRQNDALLVVDAVTSLGCVPLALDAWGVDAAYSCTQKGLGCPPGLSPVSFSPRALETIAKRKTRVQSWYFDMSIVQKYWGQDRFYHHTAPITMIFALREGLRILLEEGLQARWDRHLRNHRALKAGLLALGLEYSAVEGHQLPQVNAVKIPAGVDDLAVRKRLLDEFGIEFGGGLGDFKGKVWRIGLMGYNSRPNCVLVALSALEQCLAGAGHKVPAGAGVAAANKAYLDQTK